jgi:type IV secretion system protein VirB4
VAVVFATQSLADIETSAIAPAIIESCLTRIFLPNARAAEPQSAAVYRRFGLNGRQIGIIARATPKRDYYLQSAGGSRLFELGLGPIGLALCAAASPSDQKLIDEIVGKGPAGRFAQAFLEAKHLGWAANLLDEVVSREPDPNSSGPLPNPRPQADEDAKATAPDPVLLTELAERLSPYRA